MAEQHFICGVPGIRTLSLLFRSWGSVAASSRGSSRRRSSNGSRSTTTANVGQQLLDVLALEGLSEQLGPDGLDVGDLGGLDQAVKLVGLVWKGESAGGFQAMCARL